MLKDNQLGHNIKRNMKRFINKHVEGLSRPQERFAFDMLFGLVKGGDCKVSNIGRALDERIDLRHTIKRLYNNLSMTDLSSNIEEAMLHSYKNSITPRTVFALDFSDITKPYAEKMEHLAVVRNGDTGTFGNGYNKVVITATEIGDDNPVLIANRLFSRSATPELKSTDIAIDILNSVNTCYGNRGIYTQDRYFDNRHYYHHFISNCCQFVTRAKTNRKLLKINSAGKIEPGKVSVLKLAKSCRTPFRCSVERWRNGRYETVRNVKIGCRKVVLPCVNQEVNLIVVKGFGRIPMMLITNIDVNPKNITQVVHIFDIYRARWKTEEWIRYVKTAFRLEDVRCLNWVSLKNMISFVNLATLFISQRIGNRLQLVLTRDRLLIRGRPIYIRKAKMTLYMLSCGLKEVLKNIKAEYKALRKSIEDDIQLELAL